MRNKSLVFSATALAIAVALSACGGGGGGSLSAAPGSTTSGTLTGFGSVFVNGVEFSTTNANITVKKAHGTESNLKVGIPAVGNPFVMTLRSWLSVVALRNFPLRSSEKLRHQIATRIERQVARCAARDDCTDVGTFRTFDEAC